MNGQTGYSKAHTIVEEILRLPQSAGRRLIAISGPPAAGKSTVAELVRDVLIERGHAAGLVPMDGFHMDNAELQRLGLLQRKGAPETFDLQGFRAVLERLKTEAQVSVPIFDRIRDCTVPDAAEVTPDQSFVVVEGNYLLLDEPGWRDLGQFWDFSAFIGETFIELTRRLCQRWVDHGMDPEAAKNRAMSNDLPNAKLVLTRRLPCNLMLSPTHDMAFSASNMD